MLDLTRRKLLGAALFVLAVPSVVWWQRQGWPYYGGRAWFETRFDDLTQNRFVIWRYEDGARRHIMGFVTTRRQMRADDWREREMGYVLGMRRYTEQALAKRELYPADDEGIALLEAWPLRGPEIVL